MLRISLRDGEKVVVNGAVLKAVGRTDLIVENQVSVLRGREVMKPEEATTPARQLYFHTIMAYIDPARSEDHQARILDSLETVMDVHRSEEVGTVSLSFAKHVAQLQFYKALGDCRQLMRLEDEALAALNAAA